MDAAKRFKTSRESLSFSPKELADLFGVKVQKVRDIEGGRTKIPINFALLLDEKYSIDFKWLISGVGSMEKLTHPATHKNTIANYPIITKLEEWLTEIETETPNRLPWFEIELEDKFPLFKEWLKKRNETNAEIGDQRAA